MIILSNEEKAYMLGLCASDINVREVKRKIRIAVSSTREEIINIVKDVFGKYCIIRKYYYPKYIHVQGDLLYHFLFFSLQKHTNRHLKDCSTRTSQV